MCDLLLFIYRKATTQDEFVLFDKIAQSQSSVLLLFVHKLQKNKHALLRLLSIAQKS